MKRTLIGVVMIERRSSAKQDQPRLAIHPVRKTAFPLASKNRDPGGRGARRDAHRKTESRKRCDGSNRGRTNE